MIGIANLFRRKFLDLARVRTGLAVTAFGLLPLLAGCARQVAETVSQAPDTPGFLLGLCTASSSRWPG